MLASGGQRTENPPALAVGGVNTVCNNIEKRYQEKKKVLDQIEAPEVEIYHVEPLPTVTIDDDMMTAYQVFMLIGGLTAIASILIAIHVILV